MIKLRLGAIHLIGLAWLAANVWASLLVHDDCRMTSVCTGAVIMVNPVIFGAMASLGRRHGSSLVAVGWPAFVGTAWVVVPALGAVSRWGWAAFSRFMFRAPKWYDLVYLSICVVVYCGCLILTQRRSNGEARRASLPSS